ncbi:hypothetical protein [Nocardia sp. NPDC051570]|uniref:hypothetical protein n=1 Tax=Nocardia sp. NPDC051570 TaxID=3364324 RepID=UPI003797D951
MTSTEVHTTDEVAALAHRVATARGKLPLQTDRALYEALSEQEIKAERDLAEWIREQRRKQQRSAVRYELRQQKLARRNADKIRSEQDSDSRWHRRALAARRRTANPDARLAELYRRAEWSSRALIGVVVLGMLWAGVNVQHNLVPSGDMHDPLYWLSYGFEAMISIPIITIMVVATTAARWGREIDRGKVVFLEVALLGVTIALNAGPHLAAHAPARAAEAAIAPVMVGVVIWLHAWVTARYAYLIDIAPDTNAAPRHDPVLDAPEATAAIHPATTATVAHPEPATQADSDLSDAAWDSVLAISGAGGSEHVELTRTERSAVSDTLLGGVLPFARRVDDAVIPAAESSASAAGARQSRGRRWFGGVDLADEEIEQLALAIFDSKRTQQSLETLIDIIRAAVTERETSASAIARSLNMTAHSTVLRVLNVAEDHYRDEHRVA